MRKSMKKRMLCLLMAAVMVVLATGCGGKSTQENPTPQGGEESPASDEAQEKKQAIDEVTPSENTAMGRYVEEEADLSENLSTPLSMQRLSDGSIMILDQYNFPMVSKDNGLTWEVKETECHASG